MDTPNVQPEPRPTTDWGPKRQERPVADLERDTWIEVIDSDGDDIGAARVVHVETYDAGTLGRRSLLVYRVPGSAPATIYMGADDQMPLLTDAEIGERLDEERRSMIADTLTELAERITDPATPLPPTWRSITVDIDFGPDVDAVETIAKALDVKTGKSGSMVSVLEQRDGDQCAGVTVMWRGHAKAAA
jgi:hypothetical protein